MAQKFQQLFQRRIQRRHAADIGSRLHDGVDLRELCGFVFPRF